MQTTRTEGKQIDKGKGFKIVVNEGMLMVKYTKTGTYFVPRPIEYEGFMARDFADLHRELIDSGLKASVVDRWVNQAQGK